ncbi:MAG: hypothetical protein ACOC16_02525 [Nanoarchaeota archaeon]
MIKKIFLSLIIMILLSSFSYSVADGDIVASQYHYEVVKCENAQFDSETNTLDCSDAGLSSEKELIRFMEEKRDVDNIICPGIEDTSPLRKGDNQQYTFNDFRDKISGRYYCVEDNRPRLCPTPSGSESHPEIIKGYCDIDVYDNFNDDDISSIYNSACQEREPVQNCNDDTGYYWIDTHDIILEDDRCYSLALCNYNKQWSPYPSSSCQPNLELAQDCSTESDSVLEDPTINSYYKAFNCTNAQFDSETNTLDCTASEVSNSKILIQFMEEKRNINETVCPGNDPDEEKAFVQRYTLNSEDDTKNGRYYCMLDNRPNRCPTDSGSESYPEIIKGYCDIVFINETYTNQIHNSLKDIESSKRRSNTGIYTDLKISDDNNKIESRVGKKKKFVHDLITNRTYFRNKHNFEEEITLPVVDDTKKIKIYKNGVNVRNDTIRPEQIALQSHNIKKFQDSNDAKNFVEKSYNLMTNLNISRKFDNQTSTGNTKVKIELELPSSQRTNITIYETFSKDLVEYEDIKLINNGGAKRLIVDKDPVIGWYFNETNSNASIEYEIPGNNEGGSMIITSEAILYNQGNLIINYRENECEPNEAELFQTDDLFASKVYSPGSSKTYKVCIAHENKTLYSNDDFLTRHIFNFTNSGNISFINSMDNSVDVSVQNSSPIYWDLKIQKDNPTGDYSCLGSIENENSSLFGDCGFTNKKIWMYLGDDIIPPTTTYSYPSLAHTTKIELEAQDNIGGSGIDSTYYCVKNETQDCSDPSTFSLYNENFYLTCPNDWGCDQEFFYYSIDRRGNIESVNNHKLLLIDKGSACMSDCTAKPKPNRYIASCSNLNDCKYYQYNNLGIYDEGNYVANQCHYLIKDSWVYFNSTHEIRCPDGPFRESSFTSQKLFFDSSSCENLIKKPYSVLINAEVVTMNILVCEEEDNI